MVINGRSFGIQSLVIPKMKIAYYKKQILKQFGSDGILDIYHGEELLLYSDFNQRISLSEEVKRKRFSYYNSETQEYLDSAVPYANAHAYFTANGTIFREEEPVIYFIWYKDEYFGLKMLFHVSLLAVKRQHDRQNFLVINESLTKLLALDFLEYEIEVLVYREEEL